MPCWQDLARQQVLQEQLKPLKKARQDAKKAVKDTRKKEKTVLKQKSRPVKVDWEGLRLVLSNMPPQAQGVTFCEERCQELARQVS